MKIDIKNSSNENTLKVSRFPLDYKYFGEEEIQDDLRIFINKETLAGVDKYLSSDVNKELGGVLLGDVFISEDNKKFIVIDYQIIAKHSNSSLSRLTFTHETWDYINEIRDNEFPDKKILGWFHSHPGHTVFLSNFDMFIHENFFNAEYMVAYVYDPTIKDRGFFHWRDGKIVKSNGYYVNGIGYIDDFDELIPQGSGDDLLSVITEKKHDTKIRPEYKNLLTIGLLLFTLLILLFMIYNIYEIKQKALLREEYARDLEEIRKENNKLSDRLNELVLESEYRKSELAKNNKQLTSELSIGKTDNAIVTDITGEKNSPKTQSALKVENENDSGKDVNTSSTKYTVKVGDTLEKISNNFYGSRAGIDLIMKHNKLKNRTDLQIGRELEIPEMHQ